MANLRRVYAAIQAHRQEHKDYPEWLSDLVPQYLQDVNVLSCPVTRRTGQLDTQGPSDPKLPTSYAYQFGNQPIPSAFSGGSKRTMREWKTRQREKVGDIVPMVRCRLHSPQLNVSFDGNVFESPAGWESMLTNGLKAGDLSAPKLFPEDGAFLAVVTANNGATNANRERPAAAAPVILRIPPRDPQSTSAQIDLTDHYNAGLNEAWHARPGSGYKHSDLSWLPRGLQTFAGTEFDVRGVVQIAGRNLASSRFPAAVIRIKINRKCRALHFLHATAWSVPDGTRIGHFRIVYSDGEEQEIPILYGVDVRDWTLAATAKNEPVSAKPEIAWMGKSPLSQSQGTTLRLFKSSWENPVPQARLDTVDYVSAETNCAPFLIAITAD